MVTTHYSPDRRFILTFTTPRLLAGPVQADHSSNTSVITTRLKACPGPQMETAEGRDAHASLARGYRSKASRGSSRTCSGVGIVVCSFTFTVLLSIGHGGGDSCHHRLAVRNDRAEVKFQGLPK